MQGWLFILILFNVFSTKIDYAELDHGSFVIQTVLTLGLFVPMAIAGIALLRGQPSRLRQDVVISGVTIFDFLVVLNGARLVPIEQAHSYLIMAALIPFLAGMIVPMSFRSLALYGALCAITYWTAIGLFYFGGVPKLEVPMLLGLAILVPIKLGFERTKQERLCDLLELAERARTDELAQANERLTALSRTDTLTGLYNRGFVSERLDEAWEEACTDGAWLSVLLVDIDHFKLINDTVGHAAGDQAICQVAVALDVSLSRDGGLLARFGGEEFVGLVQGATPTRAREIGERLRLAVADLAVVHPALAPDARLSVSVGVATAPGHERHRGQGAAELLKRADDALYSAKRSGRNRVVAVVPELDSSEPPAVNAPPCAMSA